MATDRQLTRNGEAHNTTAHDARVVELAASRCGGQHSHFISPSMRSVLIGL